MPRWRQLLAINWILTCTDASPETYYEYRLFHSERRRRHRLYLHGSEQHRVLHALIARQSQSDADRIQHKETFHAWCRENGLPTVPVLATLADGKSAGHWEPPPTDIFVKPSNHRWGIGATAWSWTGSLYEAPDGRTCDRSQLLAEITELSRIRPYLVQTRLTNAASLRPLTNGALSTARIVTARPTRGDIHVLCASLRMPHEGMSVDNYSSGGMVSSIALDSGVLGAAVRKDPAWCTTHWDTHPDSGARITGTVLPDWSAAKETAIRAHQAAGEMAFVGWDIALTNDGPVLVEANTSWGVDLIQAPSGEPLGDGAYLPMLLEHIRRRL